MTPKEQRENELINKAFELMTKTNLTPFDTQTLDILFDEILNNEFNVIGELSNVSRN